MKQRIDIIDGPATFISLLKEYVEKEQAENNLSYSTINKHTGHISNISTFLSYYKLSDVTVGELKIKHLELLKSWLHTKRDIKSFAHVSRHLRLCMAAADHAIRMEYISGHPLRAMRLKRDKETPIIYLDAQEILRFEKFEGDNTLWEKIIDLFLLQCYTGLSYMDLWLFELMEDVIHDENGDPINITWVTCMTGRGKTKKKYWAELTPEAKAIIDKYEGEIPRVCNQVYNKTVKKIAKALGIDKHLTTHVARKTFATHKRRQGYSIPAIADMLGNTESVARKTYIERNKEVVIAEIHRLRAPHHPQRLAG